MVRERRPGRQSYGPARAGSRAPRDTPGSRRSAPACPAAAARRGLPPARARRTRRAARSTPRNPPRGRSVPAARRSSPPSLAVSGGPGGRPQLAPRVVQRLVERPPRAPEPLGEHVDRDAVERQRAEHLALVRGKRVANGVAQRAQQLLVLQAIMRGAPAVGQLGPRLA